jgi:hypothetical protein
MNDRACFATATKTLETLQLRRKRRLVNGISQEACNQFPNVQLLKSVKSGTCSLEITQCL